MSWLKAVTPMLSSAVGAGLVLAYYTGVFTGKTEYSLEGLTTKMSTISKEFNEIKERQDKLQQNMDVSEKNHGQLLKELEGRVLNTSFSSHLRDFGNHVEIAGEYKETVDKLVVKINDMTSKEELKIKEGVLSFSYGNVKSKIKGVNGFQLCQSLEMDCDTYKSHKEEAWYLYPTASVLAERKNMECRYICIQL